MARGLFALLAVGVLVSLAALASSQPASMVLRLDNAQLVARSHLVVHGRVTSVNRGEQHSEALVAVDCFLKGSAGAQVTVVFSPGLAESPVFEAGEWVLLFLTQGEAGRFQTTGGVQGKLSFGKDGQRRPAGQEPRPQ